MLQLTIEDQNCRKEGKCNIFKLLHADVITETRSEGKSSIRDVHMKTGVLANHIQKWIYIYFNNAVFLNSGLPVLQTGHVLATGPVAAAKLKANLGNLSRKYLLFVNPD